MRTHFPLCRATDSFWNRKVVSLLSSVMTLVCLRISCTNSIACLFHVSAVSIASGEKTCVLSSPWYFAVLLSAACLAAAPCSAAVESDWTQQKYQEQWRPKASISLWPKVLDFLWLDVCHHFWGCMLVPSLLGFVGFIIRRLLLLDRDYFKLSVMKSRPVPLRCIRQLIDWLIEHGLTSAPTQYRLYGRQVSVSWLIPWTGDWNVGMSWTVAGSTGDRPTLSRRKSLQKSLRDSFRRLRRRRSEPARPGIDRTKDATGSGTSVTHSTYAHVSVLCRPLGSIITKFYCIYCIICWAGR